MDKENVIIHLGHIMLGSGSMVNTMVKVCILGNLGNVMKVILKIIILMAKEK